MPNVRLRSILLLVVLTSSLAVVSTGRPSASGSPSGLFVVGPNGGKPKRVVSGCIEAFAWSPDGRSIALARLIKDNAPDDETVVLNLQTGQTRLIAAAGRPEPPAWSPDGSKIAFGEDDAGIYLASITGATKPKKIPADYWPAWSPDGKHIASNSFSGRIALLSPNGSGVKYLTRPRATGLDVPVFWFPDGKRLLSGGPQGLLLMNADGTGLHPVASTRSAEYYALSRDGSSIAYSDDQGRIYVLRPDGWGKRFLAQGEGAGWSPLGGWSPNGRKFAFIYGGAPYVINTNGTGRRRLGPRAGVDGIGTVVASWSPHGQIAFIDDADNCGGPS